MKKRAIGLLVLTIMLMGCSGAKDTASAGNVSSEPYGVYARINQEENFAGQDVLEEEFLYSLHEDGTGLVRCHDDYDFEYTVYPEGIVDKKDKDNAELKDKVYIRVVNGKGDEAKETVYYRYANF